MLTTSSNAPAALASDVLTPLQDLYAQGLYLQALQRGQEVLGPVKEWRGPAARILAGRLVIHLGAPRMAYWHHLLAWRGDRTNSEACYYHARALLDRRGALPAWKFLRAHNELEAANSEVRADWLAFHGCVCGRLRDFDAAEAWLARAEAIDPERPWLWIERSALLEYQDRYEEALAAARHALDLRPRYRPGLQCAAHVLQLLGRETEALDLLKEAAAVIESGPVVAQLAGLQTEMRHYVDARKSYDRLAELSPLAEKDVAKWLAARRSDAACYVEDYAAAAELARELGDDPFFKRIAERLSKTPVEGRRVLLPVGFVRQHHQTCVPATLAAISRFWGMSGDQLEIAADICYDGTPAHSERNWAETHGWVAREFTVTAAAAEALLDRGIPFTLTLVEPTFSHLQAVIGYDSRRGTLLIRDPSMPHFGEYSTEEFLKHQQGSGPRGMALVPQDKAGLLADLALPDAELYDRFYQMQRSLQAHDRDAAKTAYDAICTAAPGHRLAHHARRALAQYDANPAEVLAAAEGLLTLFPDDEPLKLLRLSALRDLARRDERLALLKEICTKPSDPVFRQIYAQELTADARNHGTARRLLRGVIRRQPNNAIAHYALANLEWDRRQFEDSTQLYRWASCLDDKDERLAQSYYNAARHRKQTPEALSFLKDRFRRFGAKSGWPARTLFWALCQLEETAEGLDMLDSALALRPQDGELLLFVAESRANHGDVQRGAGMLASAEGKCPRPAWLRAAANMAQQRGEREKALELWRQAIDADPFNLAAQRAIAQLLAESEGRPAALAHLRQTCDRFPHHYALMQILIEWLREDGPDAVEPAVRRLVGIHPSDAWSRRELALTLAAQRRLPEAFAELEIAGQLEPGHTSFHCVQGRLYSLEGKTELAKEAYRNAIRNTADCDHAIAELIMLCDTMAERREALAFVEAELVRQVIFGDGLLAFREHARNTLSADELLAALTKAREARPDLWHAWAAVIRQLTDMNRTDEALELARQATARFPLLPALWVDLGRVCQVRRDGEGEIEAIRHAVELNPTWAFAVRQLAGAYEHAGRHEEAKATLESAIRRAPLDCASHGCLADFLWRTGERPAALEKVRDALRLAPGYEWAWNALRNWSQQLGKPQAAVELARELAALRPNEARSWLFLARMLPRPEDTPERLDALNKALAINPRLGDAYDLRAELLCRDGRHDEAIAACNDPIWEGKVPLFLRGRAAWIEAQRGRRDVAIPQMRAVMAEDPNYYWGWTQLANWFRDARANAEYLQAATELVRLSPQESSPWGYLGEARLRSGDRAGGKEALQRALQIAPDYNFGAMLLFDEQLADNELEPARATLDLLKKYDAGDYVTARAVKLAVKCNDRAAALAELTALALSPRSDGWPWDTAAAAVRGASWDGQPATLLRDVAAKNPSNPRPWLLLAQSIGKPEEREERLQALEKVLALDPRCADAYDLKADLLVRAGRFEEATAACTAPIWQGKIPTFLRGRAAWIESQRGKRDAAIAQMRAVLADDRDYYWGWSQIAGWYREARANKEYLEAATNLARVAPRDCVSHGYLGEARIRTGDRAAGKEALRLAMTLDPAYPFASTMLFDTQLADGEMDAAAETLAHIEKHVGGDSATTRRVQLAAKRKDKDAALAGLAELCVSPKSEGWCWDTALAAVRTAGWLADTAPVYRGLTQKHPEQLRPWLMLARTLSKSEDLNERLAALDRVTALDPKHGSGHDLRAELLCRAGRYDAALEACNPPAFNGKAPIFLRGRAAWIYSERGQRPEAIRYMRQLVKEDADYYWGWYQLSLWYRDDATKQREFLEAAEALVRLAADDHLSFNTLGDARLKVGDRAGAKKAWQQALALEPTYAFTARTLFDAQLADREFDGAAATLAHLEKHSPGEGNAARAIALAAKRGDQAAALAGLAEMARKTTTSGWALEMAAKALVDAGWGADAETAFETALDAPERSKAVGTQWLALRTARGDWSLPRCIEERVHKDEAGRRLLIDFLKAAGKAKRRQQVAELVARYGEVLRPETYCWGYVGWAFSTMEDYAPTAQYMADWEQHGDAEAWMLMNLAFSLRACGNDAEANRVSRRAVEMPEEEETTPYHKVWLAFDALRAGETDVALKRLDGLEPEDFDTPHQWVHALVQALLAMRRMSGSSSGQKLAEARRRLADAVKTCVPLKDDRPVMLVAYRQAVQAIGAECGLMGRVWAAWRLWQPELPAAEKAK